MHEKAHCEAVFAVAFVCLCAAQNYKLYPTKSTNLFIKLDTRNGKMTYVTVYSDIYYENILNDISLVDKKEEREGRFELHPTEIKGYFILLDTLAGSCWRVEHTKGAVVPFN